MTQVTLNSGSVDSAGSLVLKTNGTTTAVTIDTAQNLGVGVTPSAWGTLTALQVKNAHVGGYVNNGYLGANCYYSGSAWNYIGTGTAHRMELGNGQFQWHTAPSGTAGNAISFTQAMTLDASGNLLVGGTSANYSAAGRANVEINGATTSLLALTYNGSATNSSYIYNTSLNLEIAATGARYLKFSTNGAEAARIDSSGNLLVGTTTFANSNTNSILMAPSVMVLQHISGTASGSSYENFNYNGSQIGSITQNGTTGVLYNLTSDYRLKNNPTPVTGAKEFVMALQPKTWDWWDGSGKGVGFIAHEFMEVAKHSGHGEKDAVDEEGNIIPQSIQPSSSEVMANLVAFIQEQQAMIASQSELITTLTERITALEGAK